MAEKKIKLLVLPTLFPKFKGDISGIFILDYIECVKPYCDITVLFLQIFGEPGLNKEAVDGEPELYNDTPLGAEALVVVVVISAIPDVPSKILPQQLPLYYCFVV